MPDAAVLIDRVHVIDPIAGLDAAPTRMLISHGTIEQIGPDLPVPPGAEVIDAAGGYAVPGMVNAHDHLYSHELRDPVPGLGLAGMRALLDARSEAETLVRMLGSAQQQLRSGITAIRDLGAPSGLNTVLADLLERNLAIGPRVVASGRAVVMTGGHVWTFGREADGPWECRQAVREQAKAGARVIKIMGSGGLSHYPAEDFTATQFTDDELAAIIDESHRRGLPCCSHVFGADAVARVVRLGVDSVEHGVQIDDETMALMVQRQTGYVPTLTNMERIASPEYNAAGGTPERAAVLHAGVVAPHHATVRRAIAAGVSIAVGTDSTGNYAQELQRLADLGMTPLQVLAAATVVGATLCRLPGGRLLPGAPADLAVHYVDPLADPVAGLAALTRPDYVLRAGRVVHAPGMPGSGSA